MNNHDAKTLKPGQTLEIQPLAIKNTEPRIGVAEGEFTVPDSFFEALPDQVTQRLHERMNQAPDEEITQYAARVLW